MTTTDTRTSQQLLDAEAYEALAAAGGNTTRGAEALGVFRTTVAKRAARHAARLAQDAAAADAQDSDPADDFGTPGSDTRAADGIDAPDEGPGDADLAAAPEPAQPAAAPRGRRRDPRFPDGVLTPVQFRDYLIAEGLAPAGYTEAYNLLRRPGFPYRHYGPDGTAYDAPQAVGGVKTTRPGVDRDAARAWFAARSRGAVEGAEDRG